MQKMTVGQHANGTAPVSQDPDTIVREITARQEHLAATVDELAYRVKPKEIARRAAASAQQRVKVETTAEDGSLRVERVGAVVAALVAIVGLAVWRRRR